MNKDRPERKGDTYFRNYKHSDSLKITNTFKEVFTKLENNLSNDIDKDMEQLLKESESTLDALFPLKKMSNRKAKQRQSKPWVNDSILKEIKKRDKIYKKMKNNTDESKTEILKMKLRIQKNKVKEVIRSAKKIYFTDYFV